MLFTPASVNPPPQISRESRFLKAEGSIIEQYEDYELIISTQNNEIKKEKRKKKKKENCHLLMKHNKDLIARARSSFTSNKL